MPSFTEYPFSLPAVRHLGELTFRSPVTFLVGENGSGKSTLLEAIAASWGFNLEGGSRNFLFATRRSESGLHEYLQLIRGYRRPADSFFLRELSLVTGTGASDSNIMSELTFSLADCSVVRLTRQDAPELQSLFERCSDYVELISGRPPGPHEAEEELRSGPKGKALVDKFALGLYREERGLIAYLDLIRDYPGEQEWWLGLLMLDPAVRSHGLGSRIYEAAARWVSGQGGRAIWIGVLEENPGAERFWRRQGFEEVRRQPFTADSGKAHTMIVLRHDLPVREPA